LGVTAVWEEGQVAQLAAARKHDSNLGNNK
jgi:hypothetical protein